MAEFGSVDFAAEYRGPSPHRGQNRPPCPSPAFGADLVPLQGTRPLPQGPADILQAALTGLEKKRQQAAAIEHMRTELSPGACRRTRRPAAAGALSPTATARDQGARGRLRHSGLSAAPCCWRAAHSRRATTSTTTASSSSTSRRHRIPRHRRARAPHRAARRGRRVLDRRRLHHRDRRRLLGDAAPPGRLAHRHPHRRAWRSALAAARRSTRARRRLSTIHMPGNKITMLPDEIVQTFTLAEGRDCPAVSLYLDITRGWRSSAKKPGRARADRGQPAPPRHRAGLQRRHRANGGPDFQWKRELTTALWGSRHRPRGRTRQRPQRNGSHRFQLQRGLDRGDRRRPGARRHRPAPAQLADGQARRRADDLRQHDLGQAARRPPASPACTAPRAAARCA